MKNKYIDNKILIKVILNMFKFNNYFLYFFKQTNKKNTRNFYYHSRIFHKHTGPKLRFLLQYLSIYYNPPSFNRLNILFIQLCIFIEMTIL